MSDEMARDQAKAEAWAHALRRRYQVWSTRRDEVRPEDWGEFVKAHDPQHDLEYEPWAMGFDAGWAAGQARVRAEYEARIAEMEAAAEDARLEFLETDR